MIPDHLIDKAAQALQDKIQDEYGWPRYQLSEIDAERRNERRKEARAALEAVAVDIWEEGAESGWQATGEGWNGEYANGTTHDGAQSFRDAGNDTPNPYRASETA